jgi:hypothetical protein
MRLLKLYFLAIFALISSFALCDSSDLSDSEAKKWYGEDSPSNIPLSTKVSFGDKKWKIPANKRCSKTENENGTGCTLCLSADMNLSKNALDLTSAKFELADNPVEGDGGAAAPSEIGHSIDFELISPKGNHYDMRCYTNHRAGTKLKTFLPFIETQGIRLNFKKPQPAKLESPSVPAVVPAEAVPEG